MTRAVVFAGPSLPPAVRPADPRIVWRPPARQGDVYRAALERPDAIGLIDGYFDAVPSVWHKEILWAIDYGIRVYGAASMGALRAAELADFGMIGVGQIYQAYRDGTLADDDEVALLHGSEETGYVLLTEAMVNVRATIEEAVRLGVIGHDVASTVIGTAKSLFYMERTFPTILSAAAQRLTSTVTLGQLASWWTAGRIDRKQSDAYQMIGTIQVELAKRSRSPGPSFLFSHTVMWETLQGRA